MKTLTLASPGPGMMQQLYLTMFTLDHALKSTIDSLPNSFLAR